MVRFICFSVLLFWAGAQVHAQLVTSNEAAITATENGQVQGYISDDIFTFKGIPYGRAERFATAAKPQPWEGVRSSRTYGPVAPLLSPTTSVSDESEFVFHHDWGYTNEDCLVLNVWSPGLRDGRKRPVMFWIHGGGYVSGSSQELPSYDGENLARSGDVVVVSINHRLNVLGFLDLSAYGEEFSTSANNSILDIRLALEWVRDNIESFGGDPGNVTVFGQSGGGAKVNALMAMPSARGLFHKAINQSGAHRADMLSQETSRRIAALTLEELDLAPADASRLREIPFAELSAASERAMKAVGEELTAAGSPVGGFGLGWGPSIDGDIFLYQPSSQEALLLSKDIPLLIGTVKNEFMPFQTAALHSAPEEVIMEQIKERHGDRADDFVAAVRAAYPETTLPSDLISVDMMFRAGAVAQADNKASLPGGAPVFVYLFTWQSPVFGGKYKALHCMDVPFAFNTIDRARNMTGGTPEAHALARYVSQAWINFARSGNPTQAGLPGWEAYTPESGATMMLDNECAIRYHPDAALLNFHREAGR